MQHQSSVVYSEQLSKILIFFSWNLVLLELTNIYSPPTPKKRTLTPYDAVTKFTSMLLKKITTGLILSSFLTLEFTVPDHDGGRPMEVNACILITHMVYL